MTLYTWKGEVVKDIQVWHFEGLFQELDNIKRKLKLQEDACIVYNEYPKKYRKKINLLRKKIGKLEHSIKMCTISLEKHFNKLSPKQQKMI